MTKRIRLALIRLDFQPPEVLNQKKVLKYVTKINNKEALPPIVLRFDGTTYFLHDGFHRVEAAKRCGLKSLRAEITPGTLEDMDEEFQASIRSKKMLFEQKQECDSMKPITISDAKCCDCLGPVTLFAVPDKVWSGLGLTTERICLQCIADRLTTDADDLVVAIKKHKRRFHLKQYNKFCGQRLPFVLLMLSDARSGPKNITMVEEMTGVEGYKPQLCLNGEVAIVTFVPKG
jgi:hypothetical protein